MFLHYNADLQLQNELVFFFFPVWFYGYRSISLRTFSSSIPRKTIYIYYIYSIVYVQVYLNLNVIETLCVTLNTTDIHVCLVSVI